MALLHWIENNCWYYLDTESRKLSIYNPTDNEALTRAGVLLPGRSIFLGFDCPTVKQLLKEKAPQDSYCPSYGQISVTTSQQYFYKDDAIFGVKTVEDDQATDAIGSAIEQAAEELKAEEEAEDRAAKKRELQVEVLSGRFIDIKKLKK